MPRRRFFCFGCWISDRTSGTLCVFDPQARSRDRKTVALQLFVVALMSTTGCSMIRQSMMGNVSSSIAESAALSFSRESDPELAAGAMPFALKTLDLLALQQPENPEILLTAGRTYIQYSAAFLDWEARKLEFEDYAAAKHLRQRATALYFRGRDYAAAALDLRYAGALDQLRSDPIAFLASCTVHDVPSLFWLASGWAAGLAADPSNMREFAYLGLIESILQRCYALDPDFDNGSLHEFFLAYEATRSSAAGGDTRLAEQHYERAVTAAAGSRVSPHVLYATTVMIQKQDVLAYRDLLQRALAFDLETAPDHRLANAIAQDKARWYLANSEEFFLQAEEVQETKP